MSAPAGAADRARAYTGLLVDWGGVMTGNVFASFAEFCESHGLDPQALAVAFRTDEKARELLFGFEEGRVEDDEFESYIGALLGVESIHGLIDKLFGEAVLSQGMIEAVRSAKATGIPTGLISNSWGIGRYPHELLKELFDGVVISGEVGIRKPALRIYELGAEAIKLPPSSCVFVDDLPFNLPPAEQLGMATIHHTEPASTIAQLERLLGVTLDGLSRDDRVRRGT